MGFKEKTAQPQELPGSWYWFSWTLLERLTWFFQRHYLIWCFDYCSAESCLTYTKLLLYELYFFNCVLLQIYNQPIKWQQFMHNMIKKTCWSSNQATEWETRWYKAHWTGHCCLFHSQPKKKKSEAAIYTGSPKLDGRRLKICFLLRWASISAATLRWQGPNLV